MDFKKHQKLLLWLFNSPLRSQLGVPPAFKGKIVKVTPNSVHTIKNVYKDRIEMEMVAMIGHPIFAKELSRRLNWFILATTFLPRFLFPIPRIIALGLTTTNFSTGSGDGNVGNTNAVWSTCHDAGTGNDANTTNTSLTLQGDRLNAGTYYIYRGFLPADTSAIGSSATITSAIMHIFSFGDQQWTGTHNISCVTTNQAATNALATSDFGSVGGSSLGDVLIDGQAALGQEYTITISNPDSNVSKTGFTKLGIREKDHDLANVAATNDRYEHFCTSEHATSGYRPYYAVTYTIPNTTNFFLMFQ